MPDHVTNHAVGKRLAAFRHERGWQQDRVVEELAALGLRRTTAWLSTIERGHTSVTLEMLVAFSDIFDTTPNHLLDFPPPVTVEDVATIRDALDVLDFIRPDGRVVPAPISVTLERARATLTKWRFVK